MEAFWAGFEKAAAKVIQFPTEKVRDKAENRRWARSMQKDPKPQSNADVLGMKSKKPLSDSTVRSGVFKQTTWPKIKSKAHIILPAAAFAGVYGLALAAAAKADKKRAEAKGKNT